MILLSHPTGNANVRAVLAALEQADLLDSFHTTLGMSSRDAHFWERMLFQKRSYSVSRERLQCRPIRELVRLFAAKAGCKSLTRHESGWASIDSIYRHQDQAVSRFVRKNRARLTGVYCYEDGALETFRIARESGLRCCYDLPIAYWETAQRLLHEEAQRLPQWEPTLGGTRDSTAKLSRKAQELELADLVVCPSQFVAASLPETAQTKKQITVAPFGSPNPSIEKRFQKPQNKKLRVLFVGSMTQRKGLGDLFAAMRLLNRDDVELVVMGSLQAPMEFYRKEFNGFTYEPVRSHAKVLELMQTCDVFCLPSIVEGRALVMQEAMSQGLPLVITPNTGGADLIEAGVTGFLVPIRQPGLIAEKIGWFADQQDQISEMSRAAQHMASQLTWKSYGQQIIHTIPASRAA